MKKKYYLRGLGFGILITTIVFSITGTSKMSDEEIIKRAEELGYVKQTDEFSSTIGIKELLETETPAPTAIPSAAASETPEPTEALSPTPESTETPEPTQGLTETPTPEPTETPTPTPIPTVSDNPETKVVTATIVIERGNTATVVCNKMQEAGIVKSGDEFKKYLVKYNLTDYINVGSYTLSSDMSFEEMASILTGR